VRGNSFIFSGRADGFARPFSFVGLLGGVVDGASKMCTLVKLFWPEMAV
jgi:hypothetical protein